MRKKRVLVAIDDAGASEIVGSFVNDLFGARDDIDIVALHVAGTLPVPATPFTPAAAAWWAYPAPAEIGTGFLLTNGLPETDPREQAQAAVERAHLDADRVEVEVGSVVDAIVDVAAREDASLVVVGSHQVGWFEKLLSGGSVSKEVTEEANRPVLVVPC